MDTHTTQYYFDLETNYGAHNYHPLPIVLSHGEGVYLWDIEGKRYYDFLSGYSAVSQGHCHPAIVKAFTEQAHTLTLTSRAFHNNWMGPFAKYITNLLGFDKVLPMNTGAEGVETAIKLCRKWAYKVKGIADGDAVIVGCAHNFHGRTSAAISLSTDPDSKEGYGPYLPGLQVVPYNDVEAIEKAFAQNKNIAGLIVEPIQGEAGVVLPQDGYLQKIRTLCTQYNVLMIADEVQTGLCRTGKMLACDHENVKADIVILGKALSGGMMPISCILANDEIMLCIKPGEHGSTFGGSPLACRTAIAALQVLIDENMAQNALDMGALLREKIASLKSPHISIVRGRGLLNAIVIQHRDNEAAWKLCLKLLENGLLTKDTHGNKIRLAPPLTINASQILESVDILKKSLTCLDY